MKQSATLSLSILLSLLSAVSLADSGYTLIRGEQWSGVNIGGSAPRTLDTVCQDRSCFRLHRYYGLNTQLLKRYGIRDTSFSELAKVSEVLEAEEKLRLPPDLGYELYQKAYHEYIIDKFNSRN